MILVLLDVVAPVFFIIGAGYVTVRTGFFADSVIDGLNAFAQRFAIPCLLFNATMTLDFGSSVNWGLLFSFYFGATVCFVLGTLGARFLFNRRPGEAVAIGFGALFSNSVMMGLPITEQAYGVDALGPNYAIVALHAPFCYTLGITAMEALRADGRGIAATTQTIFKMVVKNPLMLAIFAGFCANAIDFRPPVFAQDALNMIMRAALPTALFAVGGVLTRYTISDKIPQALMIGVLSLFVHPAITWALATQVFALEIGMVRSSVLTAAMAPGINAYIFASMYNRATGVNSSVVLLCTIVSVLTVPLWLTLIG